jgi:hypothetical protein
VINERFYADNFKDDGDCSSGGSYIMGRRVDLKLVNENFVELCVIELKKAKNLSTTPQQEQSTSSLQQQKQSTGSQQEQQKQVSSKTKVRGEKREVLVQEAKNVRVNRCVYISCRRLDTTTGIMTIDWVGKYIEMTKKKQVKNIKLQIFRKYW